MRKGNRRVWPVATVVLLAATLVWPAAARPPQSGEGLSVAWIEGFRSWLETTFERVAETFGKAGPIADPNGEPVDPHPAGWQIEAGPIADPNG